LSDTDPTASIHAVPSTSNSKPGITQPAWLGGPATHTRQSVAHQWFTATCVIACVAALTAFVGFGYAFPSDSLFGGTQFNPAAGVIGAVGAALGFLPFIGIFAVLGAKEA